VWYKLSQMQTIMPPVHERCHCFIETLPGGNQVWQFSSDACPQCKAAGIAFNQQQDTPLNEPAQMDPPTEPLAPPAIIPEEEGEDPQTPLVTTQDFKYRPRNFFKTRQF